MKVWFLQRHYACEADATTIAIGTTPKACAQEAQRYDSSLQINSEYPLTGWNALGPEHFTVRTPAGHGFVIIGTTLVEEV